MHPAGNKRVQCLRNKRSKPVHDGEQENQIAAVRIAKFKIEEIYAKDDQKVAPNVKQQRGNADGNQLIIPHKDGEHFAEGYFLCVISARRLPNAHHNERLKRDKRKGNNQGCYSICLNCVSGNHSRYNACNGELTDADEYAHEGYQCVPLLGVAAQAGQHSPIGNVVHGIGHAPEQVAYREKGYKAPALRTQCKERDNH